MKFNVASKALYATLAGVSKVINSKNSITILDNFLWEVEDNMLKITASDTENTLSAPCLSAMWMAKAVSASMHAAFAI